jgi:hypothetical protein
MASIQVHRLLVATVAIALLAGCQSSTATLGGAAPTPTSSPSGGGASGDGSVPIGGSSSIGFLGDPCNLITAQEVTAATGVAVVAVVRGEPEAGTGRQICAFAMDAAGSTAAAMQGYVGFGGDSELGSLTTGLGTSGGVVGVIIDVTDPDMMSGSGDDGSDAPPPELDVRKLDLGISAVVVGTKNGGAAFAANEAATLTIMDLIAGPTSTDVMEKLLRTAFARMS